MGLVFGIALMASLRDEGLEVTSVPGVQLVVVVAGAASDAGSDDEHAPAASASATINAAISAVRSRP